MPEEGQFHYGPRDPVTGARWVTVSAAMARAHPGGRLNLPIFLIIAYLVAAAAGHFFSFVQSGFEPVFLLFSFLMSLAGLGLLLRVPLALVVVVIVFSMSAYSLVTGIGALNLVGLAQVLALGAMAVYLLGSARANLIYRHRYRSFKGPE